MRVLPFLLVLISLSSFADGYGGVDGKNKTGEEISFSDSDDGIKILVYKNSIVTEEYKLEEECSYSDNPNASKANERIMKCNKNGKSPLAGAEYEIKLSKKLKNECKEFAHVYECVKGCENARVPAILLIHPWEC